jgi:hypothetical protein
MSVARHDTNPLGEGHKFRQGLDLHFLHHPVAMGLDRPFSPRQPIWVIRSISHRTRLSWNWHALNS